MSPSKNSLLVGVALVLILIVGGIMMTHRKATNTTEPSKNTISMTSPTVPTHELATLLLSQQWTIKIPDSEELDGRSTLFFPNRYVLLSEAGEVADQGYLEVDEAQQGFYLRNTDGYLYFYNVKKTATGFSAQGRMTTSFVNQDLGSSITFVPVQKSVTLPVAKTIQEAAAWGDIVAIDRFLGAGIAVDVLDEGGVTPLMYASRHFHPDAVDHLLSKGANPALLSKNGKNALLLAAEVGNGKTIQSLAAKGMNVNVKTAAGRTPLHLAVGDNAFELTKILIELGAEVNAKDQDGNTPLIEAVASLPGESPFEYKDNLPMIEFLVERGADVNAKSATEETALGKAIGLGLFETSKYFLSKGTNPNVTIQGQSVREFLNGDFATPEFREKMLPLLPKE
jgi:ankyrin repeat protein